ncbi:hypothetical protein F4859DRAFT_424159 [Xylaria cf. heliscus]|nr:hypothetical protein F4859DRAFT_424159 [Xylaria cf. heliscus]
MLYPCICWPLFLLCLCPPCPIMWRYVFMSYKQSQWLITYLQIRAMTPRISSAVDCTYDYRHFCSHTILSHLCMTPSCGSRKTDVPAGVRGLVSRENKVHHGTSQSPCRSFPWRLIGREGVTVQSVEKN